MIEVNGAAEFNQDYALDGADVYERAVEAFVLAVRAPAAVALAT